MLNFCLVALLFGLAPFPAISPGDVPSVEDIENGPWIPAEQDSEFLELVKLVSRDVEAVEWCVELPARNEAAGRGAPENKGAKIVRHSVSQLSVTC